MLNQQNIAAIEVLRQGIQQKCTQCVLNRLPSLFVDEDKIPNAISDCEKIGCGLYLVRFQS